MKSRWILCLLVVFSLVAGAVQGLVYAQDPPTETEERNVVFKIWDGTTRESIIGAIYASLGSGGYDLSCTDGTKIDVTADSTSVSAVLTVGHEYDLRVQPPDGHYLPSNTRFAVTEDANGWVDVYMYKKPNLVTVDFSAVETQNHPKGVDIGVKGDQLESLQPDYFTVVLIPKSSERSTWDVATDGLPAGFEDFPEPLDKTRGFSAQPGSYRLFAGFFQQREGNMILIGYAVGDIQIEEEHTPDDPVGAVYLTVYVKDYETGAPISGATVTASHSDSETPITGITQSDGSLTLTLTPEYHYNFQVSQSDYETWSKEHFLGTEPETLSVFMLKKPNEGEIHVIIEIRDENAGQPVQGVSVMVRSSSGDGGTEEATRQTKDDGSAVFTVIAGKEYEVKAQKKGYYTSNARFEASEEHNRPFIALYKTEDIRIVGANAVKVDVLQRGRSGVAISILQGELGSYYSPDKFPDEFAVMVVRGQSWDLATDGLPDIMRLPPDNLEATRFEYIDLPEGVESEEVAVLVFFYERNSNGPTILTGYSYTSATVTKAEEGGGPGLPEPDGTMEFTCSTTSETDKTVAVDFYQFIESYVVSLPYSVKGSITFPSEFKGEPLRLLGMVEPPWSEFSLDNFDGILEENTLSYSKPFKRIRLQAALGNGQRTYEFIFCQPGYETFELRFDLNDGEMEYVMEHDGTWERRHQSFELPSEIQSGTIEVRVQWPEGSSNTDEIGPAGGAIWEYLVDRSEYVSHDLTLLSFRKNFGKVTLHYGFPVGYTWEDAMVTFYEPDFVGIDVCPEIGAGDWHTGVINGSEASLSLTTPAAYVYFLNKTIFLSPADIGRHFEIASVTSDDDQVSATLEEIGFDVWSWAVTLPDITRPTTRLNLTLEFLDDETVRVVPLDVKRVLLDAFSIEFNDTQLPGKIFTPRQTEFDYCGEEFISFVTVFPNNETSPENPSYFEVDHTLLVNYYKDDVLLGTRQFKAYTGSDLPRHEIPVFRKGAPEYEDVASANRITAFLISKEGVSIEDTSFGGAVFGIGAGWGHLMPNHPEYGLGKDGMDYE